MRAKWDNDMAAEMSELKVSKMCGSIPQKLRGSPSVSPKLHETATENIHGMESQGVCFVYVYDACGLASSAALSSKSTCGGEPFWTDHTIVSVLTCIRLLHSLVHMLSLSLSMYEVSKPQSCPWVRGGSTEEKVEVGVGVGKNDKDSPARTQLA